MLTGEPARERRSPDLRKQEAHDAEVGAKAIMRGSGVVGDRRLLKDGTHEVGRPARAQAVRWGEFVEYMAVQESQHSYER